MNESDCPQQNKQCSSVLFANTIINSAPKFIIQYFIIIRSRNDRSYGGRSCHLNHNVQI